MQVRNNYDYDVFNGDIGRITDVDAIEKLVTIKFPEKKIAYDISDMNELVLAYGNHGAQVTGQRVSCCRGAAHDATLHDAPA